MVGLGPPPREEQVELAEQEGVTVAPGTKVCLRVHGEGVTGAPGPEGNVPKATFKCAAVEAYRLPTYQRLQLGW